jgi:hypothetical protein
MKSKNLKQMKMANDDIVNQNFRNDTILDYEWPPKSGEKWVIQEQFCLFLDISGFKRKYPKVMRRNLDHEGIDYNINRYNDKHDIIN